MKFDNEIGSLATAFDNMADSVVDVDRSGMTGCSLESRQVESELTERHRVEHQLRDTNVFLDSVIDNIPIMLFMKDAEGIAFYSIQQGRAGTCWLYERGAHWEI